MRIRGEFFDVNVNTTRSRGNIDIVVSTKVSKKAVVRNRIRRQTREILRNYNKAADLGGLNLRVVVLANGVGAKFNDLKNDLEHLLSKIK